jgi:hypothetical protein
MIPRMTPDEINARLKEGEVCLVRGDDSALGEAIRIGQSLESDGVATFGHAMIHAGFGDLISPEPKVIVKEVQDYTGQILRFYWPPGRSDSGPLFQAHATKRQRIANTARMQVGRRYDYLGLVGQLVRGLFARCGMPKIGRWLGGMIQWPSRWFCSEMVSYAYMREYAHFCNGNRQPSPQDIDDWCAANGWDCLTVEIVAVENKAAEAAG